jgi:hypothetical protein
MRGPYPGELEGGLSALLKQEVSAVKRPNCSTSASVPQSGECNAVAEDGTCEPMVRGEALRHGQSAPCAQPRATGPHTNRLGMHKRKFLDRAEHA